MTSALTACTLSEERNEVFFLFVCLFLQKSVKEPLGPWKLKSIRSQSPLHW